MPIVYKVLLVILIVVIVVVAVQVINAAKYKMLVNVVDGENIMGVNPLTDNLDFGDLSRNNGMTRYVTMKNGGRMSMRVIVWKFGNIADLIKTDKNFFSLDAGEETKIAFTIDIPPSAETKKYEGSVWIFRLPKIF